MIMYFVRTKWREISKYVWVAQGLEFVAVNNTVGGSNPSLDVCFFNDLLWSLKKYSLLIILSYF